MMKFVFLLGFTLSILSLSHLALAKPHVHGSGQMHLTTEMKTLEVEFELPAHDLVGFESAAKTPKQRDLVKKVTSTLSDSQRVLLLPDAAQCTQASPPQVSYVQHGKTHSEFEVTYKYSCAKMDQLKTVSVLLFREFQSLKAIKAEAVTDKGQFAKSLTPMAMDFELTQ